MNGYDYSFSPLLPEYEAKKICAPFFEQTKISFFNFARMYDDGTCYLISTHHDVMLHFYKNDYPLFAPVPSNLLKEKLYYLIPTTGLYQQAMIDVHQYFGLGNGFDIFDTHQGYIDVCCFAASTKDDAIHNYCINNIDVLENFIGNFKSKIIQLLSDSSLSRIQLPETLRLNFNSNQIGSYKSQTNDVISHDEPAFKLSMHYKSQEINFLNNKLSGEYKQSISVREGECLFYLIRGKSARETGKALNLSQRTIEYYLDSLKDKLNCKKKSDIIEKVFSLWQLPGEVHS